MTYICLNCGEVFHDPEHVHGDIILNVMCGGDLVCPNCHSDNYDEAVCCAVCGEYYPEGETYDGYCENCLCEVSTAENVLDFCEDDKIDIEVNFGAVSMLKMLGFDLNEIITTYAREVSATFPDRLRVKNALETCVKSELDTGAFMKAVTVC